MNAGHQLHDLSIRLNEANRISGEQFKELNDLKTGKDDAEQAKAIEDKAEEKHNPNKSILEEMQALTRRLDAMEAQKISDAKSQSVINASFENTISNLSQELKTEVETNEAKTKQQDLEHTKEVSALKSTILGLQETVSGLQDTVSDLVDHQISTVGVFCSLFTGRSHSCKLCVGPSLHCPDSDPDCGRQDACIFARNFHRGTI